MTNRFEPLDKGEVLSVEDSAQILIGHRTFRVGEFANSIRSQLEYGLGGWTEEKDGWFSDNGIECEVLRFRSKGWEKGRVRISLEFCPADSNSESSKSTLTSEHGNSHMVDTLVINQDDEFTKSEDDDLDDIQTDDIINDVWQENNQETWHQNQY